ncbi:MAG: PSD1 and planctomycete cytochrome C domain-containing protein [Bryobacterales bacterium]|nr:PSD1 and planctomycete cytochrome C domain-containing protein [Bryobacterales bacterium]
MSWARRYSILVGCSLGVGAMVLASSLGSAAEPALPPPARERIDFARHVEPIFKAKCYACHGPAQQMNGLRLDQREAALAGGYSGAAIKPGDSAGSLLVRMVAGLEKGKIMPPAGPRLSPKEIGILRAWIDQGAVWPESSAPVATSKPAVAHWAFRPPVKRDPPAVRQRAWVRNPIDAFILARLEAEGIQPSPEAPRTTLIRRLSLDLIGLPPTPAEVDEFLTDNRPDAYERLVDRLLASPHFGEKWARHWLDLAHYADSDGYEKDLPRPHAWRWRHWVIEALNRDMPFDQFTIEQIAGDLLPGATVEQKVATGFLRNTLTNREAGVDREETRLEQLVTRVNTVGTTWLGLTVGCAQCHDHKYDPITQREYYQLLAYFERAEEDEIDAPLPGEIGPYLRALPDYRRKRQELLTQYNIPALQAEWERNLRDAAANPGRRLDWDFQFTSFRVMVDAGEKMLHTPLEERSERHQRRLTDYFIRNPGPDFGKDKELMGKLKELREKLDKLDAEFPALSQAPVLVENPRPPKTYVRVRGDYRRKGVAVEPRPITWLLPAPNDAPPNRLTLARWLVSRDNPLTARVAVNRIWQELFGRGLVLTSEDFGTQGERPSHPELLDWLAVEFMDRGWSIKQTIRLIVTSATYRQSSNARPELESRDPDNRLLARQSRLRLQAELIRDSALAVSGLLNPEIGGRSIRPPQPADLEKLGYANSVKWPESQGKDRYRRGVYIHFQRTVPYPQLMNFDAPDANVACSRRRRSNTPLQALNLLNDPVFFEAAIALADRVLREAPPRTEARLEYAFRLCLARSPSPRERERLMRFFNEQLDLMKADAKAAALYPAAGGADPAEGAAWTAVSRVLLNLDEFITRE